jgi:hypothetical protein
MRTGAPGLVSHHPEAAIVDFDGPAIGPLEGPWMGDGLGPARAIKRRKRPQERAWDAASRPSDRPDSCRQEIRSAVCPNARSRPVARAAVRFAYFVRFVHLGRRRTDRPRANCLAFRVVVAPPPLIHSPPESPASA